jgi:hypothetical protein
MAYVNPFAGGNWGLARTDQGVDYLPQQANLPVVAIGNAVVTYSSESTGWPGGAFISYRLLDGPMAGNTVYVAEHLTGLLPVGSHITAGQQIASAQPGYPWTEWGWAAPSGDSPLVTYNGAADGTPMAGGLAFARFLRSLGAQTLEDPGPGALYPGSSVSYSSLGAGVGGGTVNAAGTPGYVPPPPAATDVAAMTLYIKTYFPQWTWLLGVPELGQIADQVVSAGRAGDAAYVNGLLQNTNWWRTTSAAYRDFFQKQATNPADYSFTTPGSLASQKFAEVMNTSAGLGVQLTADQGRELAINDLKYGWNAQQLQASIGAVVTPQDAGAVFQQLQAQNGAYLLPTNPTTLESWARNIAGGTQTLQQYDAYLKSQASEKWTGLAPQIAQGNTPNQLIDNLRQEAAKTMEVQPNALDFVNNPTYSKILDFTPPGSTVHRIMTVSEMDQYLKDLPAYGYTQNARDAQAGLAQTLAQTFGKMG